MNTNLHDLPTEFTSERLVLQRYQPGDSAMHYHMLLNNKDASVSIIRKKIAHLSIWFGMGYFSQSGKI
jgi:hypothetical protein